MNERMIKQASPFIPGGSAKFPVFIFRREIDPVNSFLEPSHCISNEGAWESIKLV